MNKEYDITIIGGCSIDYIFYDELNIKRVVPGGKGANQAVAASRAGAKVNMITRLANNVESQKIVDNLHNNNVRIQDVDYVPGDNDINKVFINSIDKDNKIIREINMTDKFTEDMIDKYKDDILKSKMVVIQNKISKKVTKRIIDFCYKNNILTVMTPSKPNQLNIIDDKEYIDKVDFIIPNEKECLEVFKKDVDSAILDYPNKLIVTLGSNGVKYFNGEKIIHVPAFNIDNVVDTTGAGDTFCGYLAKAIIDNVRLDKAIYAAQAAAAIKLDYESAQDGMPYEDQVKEFIRCMENNVPYSFGKIKEINFK